MFANSISSGWFVSFSPIKSSDVFQSDDTLEKNTDGNSPLLGCVSALFILCMKWYFHNDIFVEWSWSGRNWVKTTNWQTIAWQMVYVERFACKAQSNSSHSFIKNKLHFNHEQAYSVEQIIRVMWYLWYMNRDGDFFLKLMLSSAPSSSLLL